MWNQYNRNTFQRQDWTAFFCIQDNFAFVTSDNWQGRWHWLCVYRLSMSVWNTCGVGWGLQTVSSYENLRSNDSRRQHDERPTADACRLSQGFRAKELPVNPTRRVNMSVFCAEVFIVNWRADLRKYIKLSYCRGTARCVVSVEILPIAKQQCRKYLYDKSWTNRSYEVGGLRWADV